jgi:hypothetical protein
MQAHISKSLRRAEIHSNPNLAYAVQLVHATCCLAGSASYLDDIRADLRDCGISRAVRDHDTPVLFDWLVEALSFQGISDAVAAGYMGQHGSVRWAEIAEALSRNPTCPKLGGYWRFYNCRYHKGARTCSEPGYFDACPLPRHPLRNGRLNQMAYSVFLFMRDVADDDFVGWIDEQLGAVDPQSPDRLAACREAIIGPLRNVYGVADKVLAMALSSLLLSAGRRRPLWLEVGATFVAVDTLAAAVRRPSVRGPVLPAGRMRRHSPSARGKHRCSRVQPGVPRDVSAVRAERDLAVLRRERPRHLQRQSHR